MMYRQVLITGASRGIGQEIAYELASQTNAMVLVARSDGELANVAVAVKLLNPKCDVQTAIADLSQESAIASLLRQFPNPDVVILNAGLGVAKRFLSHDVSELQHMVN